MIANNIDNDEINLRSSQSPQNALICMLTTKCTHLPSTKQ